MLGVRGRGEGRAESTADPDRSRRETGRSPQTGANTLLDMSEANALEEGLDVQLDFDKIGKIGRRRTGRKDPQGTGGGDLPVTAPARGAGDRGVLF